VWGVLEQKSSKDKVSITTTHLKAKAPFREVRHMQAKQLFAHFEE
jgi:hypothetical protein